MNEERDRAIRQAAEKRWSESWQVVSDEKVSDSEYFFDAGVAHERKRIVEWILVETEADLPKKSGDFLVTMHTPSTDEYVTSMRFYCLEGAREDSRLRRYRQDHWLRHSTASQWVIAWMPLPEPYIKDGGQRDD